MARRGEGAADWWSHALSRPWLYRGVALVLAIGAVYFGWQAVVVNQPENSDLMFGYLGLALGVFSIALPYAANPGAADREYHAKHDAREAAERAEKAANWDASLAAGRAPRPEQPPQLRAWARWLLYKPQGE